jgi:hypothetical protein
MKRRTKRGINGAAAAALLSALLVQPVLAAAKTPPKEGYFENLIRKIVRVLDLTQIGFPPA